MAAGSTRISRRAAEMSGGNCNREIHEPRETNSIRVFRVVRGEKCLKEN